MTHQIPITEPEQPMSQGADRPEDLEGPADDVPAPAKARPAERYGDDVRRRRRPLVIGGVVLLAAAFLGWLIWTGIRLSPRPVSFQELGFVIVSDDRVDVTVNVIKDPKDSAVCRIIAMNAQFAVVGMSELKVGPTEQRTTRSTVTVVTSERAVTGTTRECRLAP